MGVLLLHNRHSSYYTPSAFTKHAAALLVLIFLLYRYFHSNPPSTSAAQYEKALVVASSTATSPNATWLSDVPPDWSIYHYITDVPLTTALSVPVNKGNEAMVYLTYIIDHYDALPDVVFFHHDHSRAWHQPLDSVFEVSNLRTGYVVERGYVSPRCLTGCENIMPVAEEMGVIEDIHLVSRDVRLSTFLSEFLDAKEELPTKIAAPCCAQFVVSRHAIRSRSLDWWNKMRAWLINTPLSSYDSGRLLEWTWHIWFGESPQFCSFSSEECLCNVFNHAESCAARTW